MFKNVITPTIRVGTDEFSDLVFNSNVFVDKSLMIQTLLEDSGKVILITRPRRWGKSLNMNMLQKFFEVEIDAAGYPLSEREKVNKLLFTGGNIDVGFDETKVLYPLKIASHHAAMKRQGRYPVIAINFKDIKGSNYQEIEAGVKNQITRLFIHHRYLKCYLTEEVSLLDIIQKEKLNSFFTGKLAKETLKDSLRFLSELLHGHFNQKVYILIDEYDTPINSSYTKFGHSTKKFEKVLELFRGILGSALKSNPYLEKGVITGILRIAKANLFSDLNNLREYTLLDEEFSSFYGFTQEEVDALLAKVPTRTDPEKIKDWYNGYTFGGEVIYNPWSIMQCLASKGKLDYYWLDSGGIGLVDKVLLDDHIQEDIKQLLEGKSIVKKIQKHVLLGEIEHNSHALYSLLLFAGYLNPSLSEDATEEEPYYCLTIPNKEVRNIYIERVTQWITQRLNMQIDGYDDFIKLLVSGAVDSFAERLQHYLWTATSYHDLSKEKDYHNLISGLLAPLAHRYHITSNQEAGHDRCDHLLLPIAGHGSHALIVEHKVAKDPKALAMVAQEGLQQIIDKKYDIKIKVYPHVETITKIAMAFCGKEVALAYQLDRV